MLAFIHHKLKNASSASTTNARLGLDPCVDHELLCKSYLILDLVFWLPVHSPVTVTQICNASVQVLLLIAPTTADISIQYCFP